MSVWTDWDPLQDIIVTDCYTGNLNLPLEGSALKDFNTILHETKDDLDNLSNYLTKLGVNVHRPKFKHPQTPIVPARDQYLVYGDTIYQNYTSIKDRYNDAANYYEVFKNFFHRFNYNWISQPPPVNIDIEENDTKWWKEGPRIYKYLEDQILWHAATMFKCGDAVILNSQGPGTQSGLEWMIRNLPEGTRVFDNKASIWRNWGHIDHGFFMTDDETVFCKSIDWVPPCLRDKNLIQFSSKHDLDKNAYTLMESHLDNPTEWVKRYVEKWTGYEQAVHFHTNALVVDSENVLFSTEVPELFDAMDNLNIRCHAVSQRHSGFWEGGIHCMTNDLKRNGNKRKII